MNRTGPLPKVLSVGEVARRSGVSVSALHFWEREGLIQGWRSGGNQRRYERAVLRRVAIIKVAQAVGIPLAEVEGAAGDGAGDGQGGLGDAGGRVAGRARPPDRAADAPPRPARRLHRLRLPVGGRMPAAQPG